MKKAHALTLQLRSAMAMIQTRGCGLTLANILDGIKYSALLCFIAFRLC